MKTSKKNYFKFAAALLFIIALALPTNMEALSGDSGKSGSSSGKSASDSGKSGSSSGKSASDSGKSGSSSGGSGSSSGGSGSNDSIPLDGGLGILVLGAAAFGIKKLRGNKEDK